tara:strand:+ start:2735 stop:3307 length:573 start_codon:yes stop_codon:yes gene_type:complete
MSQYIFPFILGVIKLGWWIMAGVVELAILLYQEIIWRVVAIPIAAILFLTRLIVVMFVNLDRLIMLFGDKCLAPPLQFVYTCGLAESGTLKTWVTTDIKSRKKTIKDNGKRNKDPALKKKWSGHTIPTILLYSLISMSLYYGITTLPHDPTLAPSLAGGIFLSLFLGLFITGLIFVGDDELDLLGGLIEK